MHSPIIQIETDFYRESDPTLNELGYKLPRWQPTPIFIDKFPLGEPESPISIDMNYVRKNTPRHKTSPRPFLK
jgi:hypothetical protein